MTTEDIHYLANPPTDPLVLSLAASGQINIGVSGFYGFAFDANIISTDASGVLSIYTQNTNPVGDVVATNALITYAVTDGLLPAGDKRLSVDSNFLIVQGYVVLKWTRTAGSGQINIVGQSVIF